MKKAILIIFLFFFTVTGEAQSMYGIKAGMGSAINVKSDMTPSIGAEYLVSPFRHIYVGGSVFFENYSFTRTDNLQEQFGGPGYIITQNSGYIFIAPKIDMGIGCNEYVHGFITGGPGFLKSGQQTNEINPLESATSGTYNGQYNFTGNTSNNITATIFRISGGFTEHIPILPEWDIIISQEYCILPSWLSNNKLGALGDNTMDIKSNYFLIQVGIIQKHNWEPLKSRRTWGGVDY
jgi:hypothetical protein